MKRILTLVLAVLLVASMTTVAFASESTTTLTANVPAATYALNIPANQEIPFGTTQADIGNITVTDAAGFAVGKNLEITVSYDAFTADGLSTTIPYALSLYAAGSENSTGSDAYRSAEEELPSGSVLVFAGNTTGSVAENVKLESNYVVSTGVKNIPVTSIRFTATSEDWGKALAGEYNSIITFTAQVVVE